MKAVGMISSTIKQIDGHIDRHIFLGLLISEEFF